VSESYIVIDVDGTLADNSWRDPFDYGKGDEDPTIKPVRDLAVTLIDAGYVPVFVSGRPDSFSQLTRQWLKRAFGWPEHAMVELHMRMAGDMRPDDVVKAELFEAHLKDRRIAYVIDDRERVVNMWRSKGLTVLDVAGHKY
jgi:hypothetical protein